MLSKKMFSAEVGGYRVQVAGNNVQVFYKKDDSVYEVKQKIQLADRQALQDLFTAIGSVIDQYSQDENE